MEQNFSQFKIGKYFENHADCKWSLSSSDTESMPMKDLLEMADEECRDMWNNLILTYPDFRGNPVLRKEVAKLYSIDANDVLIVGPQDGIYIALHSMVRYLIRKYNHRNIHAVITEPAYQSLREPLKHPQCDLDQWEIKATSNGWHASVEELKKIIKPHTKLLVVNFPHSPTGFRPSISEWHEIITLCKEKDIYLFSDEMYRWINLDETNILTSACTAYENAVSVSGLAKNFGLPGLKVGWLCTRNAELWEHMKDLKDYTSHSSSTPGDILGIIAMRNKDKILKAAKDILQSNLKMLDSFFKKHMDVFEWQAPSSSTHTLVKVKGWLLNMGNCSGVKDFCEALYTEKKVQLLPATVYDYKDEYIRIAFGKKNLSDPLKALEDFIITYKPK